MAIKTFKEFLFQLQEMPYINHTFTRQVVSSGADFLRKELSNTKTKNRIGSNRYHSEDDKFHYYWHEHKQQPLEISRIEKKTNKHQYTDKGFGDVKQIHHFMKHHIATHGELHTDTQQSKGAKHLWIGFIKSKPKNINFEVVHKNKKIPINNKNIDSNVDNIWGNSNLYSSIKIRAYVH